RRTDHRRPARDLGRSQLRRRAGIGGPRPGYPDPAPAPVLRACGPGAVSRPAGSRPNEAAPRLGRCAGSRGAAGLLSDRRAKPHQGLTFTRGRTCTWTLWLSSLSSICRSAHVAARRTEPTSSRCAAVNPSKARGLSISPSAQAAVARTSSSLPVSATSQGSTAEPSSNSPRAHALNARTSGSEIEDGSAVEPLLVALKDSD